MAHNLEPLFMQKTFIVFCLLLLCITSCHQVDSSPISGAREFCEEMALYASSNDYDKANECLERYCNAYSQTDLSIFCVELKPKFKTEYNNVGLFIANADKDKYPLFMDFMRKFLAANAVHDKVIEKNNGNNNSENLSQSDESSIFPTDEEIESTNARLPVQVADGTMFTKVEYNKKKRVQTFHYNFTQEIDENLITQTNISTLKSNMVLALRNNPSQLNRIKAGVTYKYIYKSIDNRTLYTISIYYIYFK